jgi:hypothetical protein
VGPAVPQYLSGLAAPVAILVAAFFATLGWLYAARRARSLSRKQHTINVLLQALFVKDYQEALKAVGSTRTSGFPDLNMPENAALKAQFLLVLNFQEFVAAGLRNGDLDESMIRDCMRGTVVNLFEFCHDYIWTLRNTRRRRASFEHIEWLYRRWEKRPPGIHRRFFEACRGRPFAGKRENPRDL